MRRGSISVLLAAVLIAGCSKEEPPSPPPPPPAKPALPEPPLPPLGEVRFRDWSEVDEEKFLELPAPAEAPEPKWDFSPGKKYGYDFSETISQRMLQEAQGKRAQNRSREKNRGVYEFAAGRDRSALARAKIQTQELYLNDQAASHESFAKKPPSTLDCVVGEDGTTEPKSEKRAIDDRMYMQALFALRPGTRDLTPGKITTRLAGYAKVGRYECARLESEFEIVTEKPSDRLLLRGRVLSFFALAERKFVRASAAVSTSSRGNALNKDGIWISSSLDAVTTYRVTFLEPP
jgi:hypothetical protein